MYILNIEYCSRIDYEYCTSVIQYLCLCSTYCPVKLISAILYSLSNKSEIIKIKVNYRYTFYSDDTQHVIHHNSFFTFNQPISSVYSFTIVQLNSLYHTVESVTTDIRRHHDNLPIDNRGTHGVIQWFLSVQYIQLIKYIKIIFQKKLTAVIFTDTNINGEDIMNTESKIFKTMGIALKNKKTIGKRWMCG